MKKHLLLFLLACAFACTSCYTVNEPQPEGKNEDEVYVENISIPANINQQNAAFIS